MAITYNDNHTNTPNGSHLWFGYTFPTIETTASNANSEVKVALNGVTQATTKYTVDSTSNPTRITFNNTSIDTDKQESTGAPKTGVVVRVYRDTSIDSAFAVFAAGSTVRATDLNSNEDQILYALQEEQNQPELITDADIIPTAEIQVSKLKDGTARQVLQTDAAGTDVEWTSNVDVPGTLDVTSTAAFDSNVTISGTTTAAAINATAINASGAVGVDGNFDVNTNKFTVASSSGNTAIAGNLEVGGTFDVTGTSNYTGQQTVPGGALVKDIRVGLDGNNEVSTASGNLVLDSASGTVQVTDHFNVTGNADVDSNLNVDGTLTVDGTSTLTGNTSIGGTLTVTGTTNLASSSIGRAEIANDAIDGTKINDNSIDSEHYVDGSIDHVHLSNDCVDEDNIQDNAVRSEHIQANAVTDSEIATGTLDNRYFTETELTGGALDGRYFTETESDARYFNISTGDTIKDGDAFPDNDTTIATTAAINDRIIDLVDDVGGFVPIANETSFPNANPDVNNGTGTLISIKALASNQTSNGSGVITISNGTVGNSTVTITGADNSTTYAAGFGLILETTTTLNTYTFHRLVPKATEVTTVAGKATEIGRLGTAAAVDDLAILGTTAVVADLALLGTSAVVADMALLGDSAVIADMATIADTSNLIANIGTVAGIQANVTTVAGNNANVTTVASNISDVNNFADLYQIASSNPSTDGGGNSLAVGDLYFNTSADELKVWNGSAWQGGVTASGNFAAVTGNTFTGDNKYNDGVKVLLGTGSDLELFHASDVNNIKSVNGKIVIQTTAGNADIEVTPHGSGVVKLDGLSWPTADGSNGQVLTTNGSGSLSFTTVAVGGATGTDYNDDVKVRWGTGNDLEIYHTGTNGIIDNNTGQLRIQGDLVRIMNSAGSKVALEANVDNNVELYYDNSKKLETTASGVNIPAELTTNSLVVDDDGSGSPLVLIKADDNSPWAFQIRNDSYSTGALDGWKMYQENSSGEVISLLHGSTSSTYLKHSFKTKDGSSGTQNTLMEFTANRGVDLYHQNTRRLETYSQGVSITGKLDLSDNLDMPDAAKVILGTGDDLKIYHNGSDSYIEEGGTGALRILSSDARIISQNNSEDIARFIDSGAVELYYDNSKKLATSGSGVEIENGDLRVHLDFKILNDNRKAVLGAGGDLSLYHTGSQSRIENITGELRIQTDTLQITDKEGSDMHIECNHDNNVELYFDNSKKLETLSDGVLITGQCRTTADFSVYDNVKFKAGSSSDLQIYHDGTNSFLHNNTGRLRFETDNLGYGFYKGAGAETVALFNIDGAVELYYNNVKQFETIDGGIRVTDSKDIQAGSSGDFKLYHNGSDSYIDNLTGAVLIRNLSGGDLVLQTVSAENNIKCQPNSQVSLYYDNSEKIRTTSTGFKTIGNAQFDDDRKVVFGDSQDFEISHNGSSAYSLIRQNNGPLYIQTDDTTHGIALGTYSGGETMGKFKKNGEVQLFYDNAEKFSTQSWGVSITGNCSPGANNSYDLGASTARWNNLYVNDMHFSNHPDNPNSVDGTWGDWTLQEGENDIFMLNNRSGKKYKMNLTEVS